MIDMGLYKKLKKQWSGRIYQEYKKEWRRFEHFTGVADQFAGRNVLEIGCNAGIQSLEICQYAKSWTGIEMLQEYYDQLAITLQKAKCRATPLHLTLKGLCEAGDILETLEYDSLFTSFVLYHLSDEEVKLLESKVLPRVDFWMVYNRTHRPTIKNSYGFEFPDKTVKFMEKNGFSVKWKWGPNKLWSFFRGYRKHEDNGKI